MFQLEHIEVACEDQSRWIPSPYNLFNWPSDFVVTNYKSTGIYANDNGVAITSYMLF